MQETRKYDQSNKGKFGLKDTKNKSPKEEEKDEDLNHECCPRSFINEEEKVIFSNALSKILIEEDGPESAYLI